MTNKNKTHDDLPHHAPRHETAPHVDQPHVEPPHEPLPKIDDPQHDVVQPDPQIGHRLTIEPGVTLQPLCKRDALVLVHMRDSLRETLANLDDLIATQIKLGVITNQSSLGNKK